MVGGTLNRQSPWVLFGLDLSRFVLVFRVGLQQLLWEPSGGIRVRLESPVAVYREGAGAAEVFNDEGQLDAPLASCRWRALALSDEVVLERTLVLPVAIESELEATVELEVEANSPFPPEERVFGWRVVGRDAETVTVVVAITSRAEVGHRLHADQEAGDAIAAGGLPEVWHISDRGVPVVIAGFGEDARERAYRSQLAGIARTAGLVACLVLLILVMPVIASTMRADRLEHLMEEVRSESAEEMRLREKIGRSNSVLEELKADLVAFPDPRGTLNLLASDTPDTVFLNQMDIRGTNLRINGFAGDAATFMQQLSEVSWLSSVEAPAAFQRDPRSGLERFLLDTTLATEGGSGERSLAVGGQP